MRRYVLKRVLLGIVTLIGVSIIVFVAARLSGDVALLYVSQVATEEDIQAIRVKLGLDKPIPVQYYLFVKNALRGDFGDSLRYGQPAMRVVLSRIPATLQLGVTGWLIGMLFGVATGIFTATKHGTWMDWVGKFFAMIGQAAPEFWIGIMLILLFSVHLGWLPTSGYGSIKHMILPAVSLSLFQIAANMRMTRSSMLEVLDTEYVKLARIKGNSERVVIWKHALRNALIPVVAMSGMGVAMLIGGVAIIEMVFRWPGLGQVIVTAVSQRDYAVVQAGTIIISAFIITVNLIVDLLFGFIDPRIRYE